MNGAIPYELIIPPPEAPAVITLENIARRLRERRAARRLSCRGAGKEIGVSVSTVSRVERGFNPNGPILVKIAQWLGPDLGLEDFNNNMAPARLSQKVQSMLDDLVGKELFGATREAVIERLVCERLRELRREGWC